MKLPEHWCVCLTDSAHAKDEIAFVRRPRPAASRFSQLEHRVPERVFINVLGPLLFPGLGWNFDGQF